MIKKSITSKMKARRKNMVSEKPLGVRGSKNQQKSRAAKRQATKEIQKQFKSDHLGSKPTFKTSPVVAHRKKRQKKQQCKDNEEAKTQIDPAWEHVSSSKSHHKSKQSPSHQKSLEETKSAYIERDFSNVAEMACFYPTEEEFSNPIVYFEKLYSQGAWRHGCVKIIPPASFKPPFSFNYKSSQKLPFRSQTVQNLSRGKEFKYDSEGETFEQFKAKALKLEKAYLGKLLNAPEEERNKIIQQDYWNLVESHSSELFDKIDEFGESITHEEGEKVFRFNYAADLPVNKYGSGFPTKEQDFEHGSHPFNFNNINDQERSLLAFCKGKDISGINIPWFYMGMLYSSFCWHYEDLMMYSLNYMHEGAGKIWYSISPEHRTKFEKVAHKKFEKLRQQDPNYLLNIN